MAHSESVQPDEPQVTSISVDESGKLTVQQVLEAGYRTGYQAGYRDAEQEHASRDAEARKRRNARWDRQRLGWIALLLREAERRGEKPRSFVAERMVGLPTRTLDRRIADARYLLEHDERFALAVARYRIKDA